MVETPEDFSGQGVGFDVWFCSEPTGTDLPGRGPATVVTRARGRRRPRALGVGAAPRARDRDLLARQLWLPARGPVAVAGPVQICRARGSIYPPTRLPRTMLALTSR